MFIVAFLSFVLAFPTFTYAKEHFFSGLGNYHRVITTESPVAQKYFDQGLAFLFAFNHDEAIRSFTEATRIDPKCTMCWWGLANAHGPHINNPIVDEAHSKAAWVAVQRGLAKGNNASALEGQLMEAMAVRFAAVPPKTRTALDLAYADAMRKIWQKHPHDADVGVLFAEAMMDLRPWDLWTTEYAPQPGTLEIVETLKSVLKMAPNHPQANHLFIHAVEASAHPEDAVPAADRLRDLQPALGHMVHMPSHIDVRTGRWNEAITANEKAIKADAAYRAIRPVHGFYHVYMAHNQHMLAYAAMMNGQSQKALEAIDALVAKIPAEWLQNLAPIVDGFVVMPLEVRVRFGKWDEILKQPEYPENFPISRTIRHAARSIAFSATGRVDEAKKEQKAFLFAKQKVGHDAAFGNNPASAIIAVAEHLMNGEILLAEKKIDASIAELRKAVVAEDKLRYDEPPDWIQPARHALGAVLLSAGRNKEAVEVYRADLLKIPNNGWALFGLSEGLSNLGEVDEAKQAKAQFEKVWANADMKISSSCLCVRK